MLPSTGKFKEINCPFFDSGLCERPYCHFRHVKKDPSEALQNTVINAGSTSISSLSLGGNGEILQQLVSEAVRKVLEQTDLPLARSTTSNAVDDVSRNLVTKVAEVLVPPLAAPAPSASTFNAAPTQQKVPSYKPTPISLLKQNRHIPIPYCPSLCKTSSVLRKRSGSDDASLAQKKIKPENVEVSPFSSLFNATSPTLSGGSSTKSYETENRAEHNVPEDRVGDSFLYSPAPLKGWKDNGLKYTPSSIETLKQQNAYVPSSRTPTDLSVAPYEPSEKSKSSVEPIYEPLAANGSSVRGAPYEPSRVSNVEPEYQPLCCDNTAKEYVPTDISKLENIENEGLDINQKIELLHNYLHEEINSVHTSKQKTSVGGGDLEVTSSDEVLKVVSESELIQLSPEKTKCDSEKSKSESTKKKPDDKRKHNEKKRSDSDRRKSDDKKRSESDKKTESSKKKKEIYKKSNDGSKSTSSSGRKKSESDRKGSDADKKKSESKHKSEQERENKAESDKKKSDVDRKSSAEKKPSEHSYKKKENEKKQDSDKKKSENEKRKSVSSKHSDVKEKSSSLSNHKHKSNSDLKQSSKSSSSSQSMSKSRCEESKKYSQSNKKSSNSQYERRIVDKLFKFDVKCKEEISRRKRSDESEERDESRARQKKKIIKELETYETDSSNEVGFGNSVSESETSDVEDILDSVTLPNDTWASSDEDSITKECYRIFQEYAPSSAPKKAASFVESLKEETYVATIKKRVAREGAENSKVIRPATKRAVGPSPGQTLSERFQKMREMFSSSQTANPPNTMRSPPLPSSPSKRSPPLPSSPSKQSPPLPIARLESKSPSQSSLSVPPVGIKKRIAHVPNVSVLLDAKLKMQQKLKEQQMSTDHASKLISITTKAQTVTKGSQRVAHMPSEQTLKRPIITEIGGKIPSNVRQTYLNILVDEYLKVSVNEPEAFYKAEEEEKSIYSRSTTRAVYASHVSNTINRLRKAAQSSSASTSVKTEVRIVNRTISHTSMLAGKSTSKGSWSIEKPRKPPSSVTSKPLYEQLLQFVMTEEQLKQNGYPMSHEDEKGVAVIHNFYKKPFVPKTSLQRMCARCYKVYYVNQQGRAVKEENCVYHWGRLFQSKTRGGWEARYNCCQGHGEAIGCSVGACHVSDNFDPNNLRGFVKTLPKEKPPSDGDYGVYALDCEMCYTTVGLELTRITVIGSDLHIVYETLVRPESAILDYNTKFSGIKEEDLEDITTNIYEVQSVLLSFINDKTILIGHSLESDFKALKLIHSTVVDTSVVYPHKMGPPKKRALKTLCRDLLQKIIQESENGHDSAEDARAAMEIMLYKVKEEMKTSW